MEERILEQVNSAIAVAIKSELVGYNKPLSKLTEKVIEHNSEKLFGLINNEFSTLLDSNGFRDELKNALNTKLARVLVSRMGGELEKQVNKLKQNPATSAKITIAIDEIISEL